MGLSKKKIWFKHDETENILKEFGKVLNLYEMHICFVKKIWSFSLNVAPFLIGSGFLLISFLAGSLTPKMEASTFLRDAGGLYQIPQRFTFLKNVPFSEFR
jgi:hypothetical protein